ncbi:AVAST type 4 anti-phage nuclease Avs4 [Sphaerochaeta sp.]|uniref:AVAST type 4 anti-phage nuclease Avs4 n=1 Tax=Sphaerochaeta sp. TaxID=1972642 RepID=UPI003D0CBE86
MIKPNWDIFKSKFSDNPQSNFEWLCYMLFCKKFRKQYGIFRYKNQAAIETEPISVESDVIGWQAKFYDTPLSFHAEELLKTIKNSKDLYPDINKLYIYSNKEWGQVQGKKPKGLKDIEEKAKELNIEIVWQLTSFFESTFVSLDNELLVKYFFSNDKSIFDLIREQEKHTQNILNSVPSEIFYKHHSIKIDRIIEVEQILNSDKNVFMISGKAGVGKTIVVKQLYDTANMEIPFYVFKASEFNNLRTINDFFKDFCFNDFISAHEKDDKKFVVIDSAEKLLDLNNTDPFKEFISNAIEKNWKIIFTTREHYLDDLNYIFIGTYHIKPSVINIAKLTNDYLHNLSDNFGFKITNDSKLLDLLSIPFYLSQYLHDYSENEGLNYLGFKEKIWNQSIKCNTPAREICFIKIAHTKTTAGLFYVSIDCDAHILEEFHRDGILGYDTPGYFIAHDIYEDWALERYIEREYVFKANIYEFYQKLSSSLPIRRSFRNWLNEKLLIEDSNIFYFIDNSTFCENIADFWRDEILISVLLSDYSDSFFQRHKNRLLENNAELLKRFALLLRVACKEIDDDIYKRLGIKIINFNTLKFIFTKPKGGGWKAFINFIYENIHSIGFDRISFVLPLIYEWNNKIHEGETTRQASLIALMEYQWSLKQERFYYKDSVQNELFQTILNGAAEIKNELAEIFDQIEENKWSSHRDPYYKFIETILESFDGLILAKVIPNKFPKLMTLFWTQPESSEKSPYNSRLDVDDYFGLKTHYNFFPASALQTPIYFLLQSDLKGTVDFILNFIDIAVEKYAKSGFDHSVEEIDTYISENNTRKQYISSCLWCMYRGTGSPAAPDLLESIHMALEKFFLESSVNVKSDVLESWLLYMLRNTKSASIASVVSSIVRAFPEKTFNVAKLLFQTKEFFRHDTLRLLKDQSEVKSLYSLGKGLNTNNDIFIDERLDTCKAKYRELSLEHLCLNYQVFCSQGESESDVKEKQKVIWSILDEYYSKIDSTIEETDEDKTWRMYLARMDYRKMKVKPKEVEDGFLLEFEPELTPELKDFSNQSKINHSEITKYTELLLWSDHKFNKDEKSKNYPKYEDSLLNVLKDVKAIYVDMQKQKDSSQSKEDDFESISSYNSRSILSTASAVLLRDYFDGLNDEDRCLCKDIVLERTASFLFPTFDYQVGDGIQQAFQMLPLIFDKFESERDHVKILILLGLFNEYPISAGSEYFSDFSIAAIHALRVTHPNDANSILYGYLIHRPKYSEMVKKIKQNLYKNGQYDYRDVTAYGDYILDNKESLQLLVDNVLNISDLGDFDQIDLEYLCTAFKLLPLSNRTSEHYTVANRIIAAYATSLFTNVREDGIDYPVRNRFLEAYVDFILNTPMDRINAYLFPILNEFKSSETAVELFNEFITVEDKINAYDSFWAVWNTFKEKIIALCSKGDGYGYISDVVKSYLFSGIRWKEDAKDWHSFKQADSRFFSEISQKLGHCPSVLYAIAKLINGVGSFYINEGIYWIADIIKNNPELVSKDLERNTEYHIECIVRRYIYENREDIKKSREQKGAIVHILDFLVKKESVVGYILREMIL